MVKKHQPSNDVQAITSGDLVALLAHSLSLCMKGDVQMCCQ
jgi:hypothetical protein